MGEQPESVKLGEAIVLQTLSELEVEALPADLIEKIEVDIANLKDIGDAITAGQLQFDKDKLTIQVPEDEIVVKLAPAVTAEMEKLLEEQAAETAAAVAETEAGAEAAEKVAEGEAVAETEAGTETEVKAETEETSKEASKEQ